MLVATEGKTFVQIGTVQSIQPNPTEFSSIIVQWMQQQKAPHKSRWLRFFEPSTDVGIISFAEILLYDFQLTKNGGLKKNTGTSIEHYIFYHAYMYNIVQL